MSDKRKETQEPKREGETRGLPGFDPKKFQIRREVHLVGMHTGAITCLAVTPDGRWLVTGSHDGTACLWDIETAQCIKKFQGHKYPVNALAITPTGKHLVTGSSDRTARLWDLNTGECQQTFSGHTKEIRAVVVTPDGRRVVTGSWDHTARLWDIETGALISVFEHEDIVRAVAVTPKGKRLVTGSDDGTARLWDLETGECLQVFEHEESVKAVAMTPDGRRLVTVGGNHTARLWDLASGKPRGVFEEAMVGGMYAHNGIWIRYAPILTVTVTPDGKWLVTNSLYWAKLWDMNSQKPVRAFGSSVSTVAVTPDSRYVIIGSHDGTAQLWDIATGKRIRTFGERVSHPPLLVVTPDGRRLAVARYFDVGLWDLASGRRIKEIGRLKGHRTGVEAMAATPDGRHLVTGRENGSVQLWDLESGELIRVFEHGSCVGTVAVTPDGRYLLTATTEPLMWNDTVRLWDLETGECLQVFEHEEWVKAVAVTPDGTRVVISSGSTEVWDSATGECLYTFDESHGPVVITPDGSKAIIGRVIWDLKTYQRLGELEGHKSAITAATLAPDGKWLVTGSTDGTARLWDIETGECVRVFKGHTGPVRPVAITPDGSKLITTSRDYTVRFWDLETGELLVTMYPLEEGFLWTTPPTKNAPAGWLWTDRLDLISVVQCDVEDGANPVPLPPGNDLREAYLTWVNDQKMVMDRLRLSWEEIQALEENRKKFLEGLQSGGTSIDVLPEPSKEGER